MIVCLLLDVSLSPHSPKLFVWYFCLSFFPGLDSAAVIIGQIGSTLLSSIGAGNTTAGADNGADTDNGFLWDLGVPAGVLLSEGYVCVWFLNAEVRLYA